jgi:hypothetical protein
MEFHIGTSIGIQYKQYDWRAEGVGSGDVYWFNDSNFYWVNPGEWRKISYSGHEEDGRFDSNDWIPGNLDLWTNPADNKDPANTDFATSSFLGDQFHYTFAR